MTASLYGHHRTNREAKLKALPLYGEKECKGGIPTRKRRQKHELSSPLPHVIISPSPQVHKFRAAHQDIKQIPCLLSLTPRLPGLPHHWRSLAGAGYILTLSLPLTHTHTTSCLLTNHTDSQLHKREVTKSMHKHQQWCRTLVDIKKLNIESNKESPSGVVCECCKPVLFYHWDTITDYINILN